MLLLKNTSVFSLICVPVMPYPREIKLDMQSQGDKLKIKGYTGFTVITFLNLGLPLQAWSRTGSVIDPN